MTENNMPEIDYAALLDAPLESVGVDDETELADERPQFGQEGSCYACGFTGHHAILCPRRR